MDAKLALRTLSVGFEGAVLEALRHRFDIRCAICDDSTADINWWALYELDVPHENPHLTEEMLECFIEVKKNYQKFCDINSRRFLYVAKHESEIYNSFVISFYKIFRLLKSCNIELVLCSNIPHEGFDFITYHVARFLNIKTIMCYQSLFAGRFWLSEHVEDFGKHSLNPVLFSKEASDYVLPDTWFYMKGKQKDAAYGFKTAIKEILRSPRVLPFAWIRYIYAWKYRRAMASLTQPVIQGEPYIYFPLHLQPELSTSALGGEFADQLLAIEMLSAWVPDGCAIYLKENPKQTEKQRDKFFYKRLAALKNVRLLSRQENSISLIQGSLGVATITGTAGWEALFHGKPVLTFGLAWYREFPGVSEFESGMTFQKFVESRPPDQKSLVKFLDLALQKAGKGAIDANYAELVADYSEDVNARSVAESVWNYAFQRFAV